MFTLAWRLFESTIAGRRRAAAQNSIFEPNSAALYHNFRFRQQVRSPMPAHRHLNTVALRHELVYFAASLNTDWR